MEPLKKHLHFFDKVDKKVFHLLHKTERKHDKAEALPYCLQHFQKMKFRGLTYFSKQTKQHINIYWDKGSNNHADYWTKHWPSTYHQQIRPTYILIGNNLSISMNMIALG